MGYAGNFFTLNSKRMLSASSHETVGFLLSFHILIMYHFLCVHF